jgi:hypothetical protein
LGEWFSKIQRRYWLPKWGARVVREPEIANIETNANLDVLKLAVHNNGSMISRMNTNNFIPHTIDEENERLTSG